MNSSRVSLPSPFLSRRLKRASSRSFGFCPARYSASVTTPSWFVSQRSKVFARSSAVGPLGAAFGSCSLGSRASWGFLRRRIQNIQVLFSGSGLLHRGCLSRSYLHERLRRRDPGATFRTIVDDRKGGQPQSRSAHGDQGDFFNRFIGFHRAFRDQPHQIRFICFPVGNLAPFGFDFDRCGGGLPDIVVCGPLFHGDFE